MKKFLILVAGLSACLLSSCSTDLVSPNGKIKAVVNEDGIQLSYDGVSVQEISISDLGTLEGSTGKTRYHESYDMVGGKQLKCTNEGVGRTYSFANAELELRVYDDGIAYRFTCEGNDPVASYRISEGTNRWMATMKTDYERPYPKKDVSAPGKVAYPALVECADGVFELITEAGLERGHCASHLVCKDDEPGVYYVETMEENPGYLTSPWRVIIMGSLADVVESTLVTDLSPACVLEDTSWIHPGVSAWIYWANNHGSKDYQKVIEYIDLAAQMQWPYDLIDWEWDVMDNGGDIYDALAYAKEKGVKVTLWYNSGTSWIGPGAPGPIDRLLTHESREKEMTMLEELGVAGIKVDFFADDKCDMVDYYLGILEDAAAHHLTVDFHGCTIPRGWQRTYPNMVSMEAVYGAEWYNNIPFFGRSAASHNATLPFTRNVIGPMDYTPGTFSDSQHPHFTTYAHELALPVLFESTIQHMPDSPESYASLPEDVRALLTGLPTAWDETRLLAGYPGEYVVMARRSGDTWYIAGINGTEEEKTITFSASDAGIKGPCLVVIDGMGDRDLETMEMPSPIGSFVCRPRGGFVIKTL